MKSKYKILVIGDACIDRFVYCDCKRLCPEAPVPVLDIKRTTENHGMAGNVIANLVSLNGDCDALINENFEKVTKTRYVEEKTNHMFVRIDHTEPIKRVERKGLHLLLLQNYDAVIISDYDKGFLMEDDIQFISLHTKLSFLDTKKPLGKWANSISYININRKEFSESLAGIKEFNLKNRIIQTLGSEGSEYLGKIYPVEEVEIKDLSGAGDTFLSALVVKFLETKSMEEAIIFANECATKVVQKKGVSCI